MVAGDQEIVGNGLGSYFDRKVENRITSLRGLEMEYRWVNTWKLSALILTRRVW